MQERKFNDQEIARRKKLLELKTLKSDPFSVESVQVNYSLSEVFNLDENFSDPISCAGRVLLIRQTFFVISENNYKLQAYIDLKKEQGKQLYNYFKKYIDIGDYLFLSGHLFRTKTGMLTIKVAELKVISKSLKPLPEKHRGITSSELSVRNRTGTLITNSVLFENLLKRSEIIFELRSYLHKLGYIEFETPILNKIAGGAIARPFKTYHNSLKEDLYLRVAPELYLKRLVTSGFTKVYEIGRSFRNEGIDNSHNPEFSSIEIYTAYFGMFETLDFTEKLITHLLNKFHILGEGIANPLKFNRVAIWELLEKKVGVNFYTNCPSLEEAIKLSNSMGVELDENEKSISKIYEKLFEELISPTLNEPTFVYGFSSELSPLAKKDSKNNFFALRFELYVEGKEIANGFAEQNDPVEQEKQFAKQVLENYENKEIDHEYISSIEYGLPPTGGVGIGIDRLMMFILGRNTIKDVIAFPFLKG